MNKLAMWSLTEQEYSKLIKDLRNIIILNAVVVTENALGGNPKMRLGGSGSETEAATAQIAWDWLEHFGEEFN